MSTNLDFYSALKKKPSFYISVQKQRGGIRLKSATSFESNPGEREMAVGKLLYEKRMEKRGGV